MVMTARSACSGVDQTSHPVPSGTTPVDRHPFPTPRQYPYPLPLVVLVGPVAAVEPDTFATENPETPCPVT
jgi:hypothetical protein